VGVRLGAVVGTDVGIGVGGATLAMCTWGSTVAGARGSRRWGIAVGVAVGRLRVGALVGTAVGVATGSDVARAGCGLGVGLADSDSTDAVGSEVAGVAVSTRIAKDTGAETGAEGRPNWRGGDGRISNMDGSAIGTMASTRSAAGAMASWTP
jgi:hypothetical protein